jgi:hypothetical protein
VGEGRKEGRNKGRKKIYKKKKTQEYAIFKDNESVL